MTTRWRVIATALSVIAAPFASPAIAAASPVGKVQDCSRVEYRTQHLEECNLQQSPFLLGGGGGDRGFVGGILHGIPGLGGLF